MSKRAIILAGGKGTRLLPYTVVLPKPLMPIGEFPILEVIVRQLVRHGFDHVTMAVNHQAEIIRAFFQDGAKWGVKIDYSLEDKPLSTMAPLARRTKTGSTDATPRGTFASRRFCSSPERGPGIAVMRWIDDSVVRFMVVQLP